MTLRRRLEKLEGKDQTGVDALIAHPRPGEDANTAIDRATHESHGSGKAAVRYVAVMPERAQTRS